MVNDKTRELAVNFVTDLAKVVDGIQDVEVISYSHDSSDTLDSESANFRLDANTRVVVIVYRRPKGG